jgi:diadenosine tetraphosphate (Ap4A) HIT family hydrolase
MDGRARGRYEPARAALFRAHTDPFPLDKFAYAPAFLATSEAVADLKLCAARLQNDARWPWIVLIPRKVGAREIEHLSAANRAQLMEEIVLAGAAVRAIGAALGRPVEKLNVGQLGNITPQLHVHVLGRRPDDGAWPGPVWGVGEAVPYSADALATALSAADGLLRQLRSAS